MDESLKLKVGTLADELLDRFKKELGPEKEAVALQYANLYLLSAIHERFSELIERLTDRDEAITEAIELLEAERKNG